MGNSVLRICISVNTLNQTVASMARNPYIWVLSDDHIRISTCLMNCCGRAYFARDDADDVVELVCDGQVAQPHRAEQVQHACSAHAWVGGSRTLHTHAMAGAALCI